MAFNAYITVDELVSTSVLDIQNAEDAIRLLRLIEAVSLQLDRFTKRHFYSFEDTKFFDGPDIFRDSNFFPDDFVFINQRLTRNRILRNSRFRVLQIDDLIALSGLGIEFDTQRSGVFDTALSEVIPDFFLLPHNGDPANADNQESRPFTQVFMNTDFGEVTRIPFGKRVVRITGKWGYWEHLEPTALLTNGAIVDATVTTITIDSNPVTPPALRAIRRGHTILIDLEQMYVEDTPTDTTLLVRRGLNNTTPASHLDDSVISKYLYPDAIREATILQTGRLWGRKDTAFSTMIGLPGTGQMEIERLGIDADVQQLVQFYRKRERETRRMLVL